MTKILLVDDEQSVLNALRRELRDYYEIEAFHNPAAAIERCRNTQFDLVVADYQMPHMNGIEFLEQFGRLQPDASRVVLSGVTDLDALISGINDTHIYRFLAKPWDQAELLSSIQRALIYRETILDSRGQVSFSRKNAVPAQALQGDYKFRIVVVESDDYLLNLMSHELAAESGHTGLYSAIKLEIQQEAPAPNKKFKCVVNGFHSAQSAVAHINQHDCDLVISAQTLSDVEGIKLLSEVWHSHPDVAFILLRDDADKSMRSPLLNELEMQNLHILYWANFELRSNPRRQAWNLHQLKTAAIQALASRELLLRDTR